VRVGINLRTLNPGKIGGMEQYVRNLIWYGAEKRNDIDFFLFLNNSNEKTFKIEKFTNIHKIILGDNCQIYELYKQIQNNGIDLWFCPLLVAEPHYLNIPMIINIPDIQHEYYPQYFTPEILNWRKKNFKLSANNSDAVLTLSEYSKKTICEKYNVSEENVYSIYLDSGKEYYEPIDSKKIEKTKEKYNLFDEFIFFPANTWAHKNHKELLKAVWYIKERYNKIINIVFTGSMDSAHKTVLNVLKNLKLNNNVKFLGYIPEDDMPYIYKLAKFLVFPSKFEGFGIPIVEAMRTGCAVTCSNIGSIPEVAEQAALYFNPNDYKDIAEKISLMFNDETRKDLIKKGFEQCKKFSWEKTAVQTFEVFEKVVKESQEQKEEYKPLISIITPSYNQGKFIEETIKSVLGQDYDNIEYIVMDGGSTDNTVEILKKYGDRIKWFSEKDKGQSDAVNKSIKIAKGELIGWLNSDDTYLPGALSNVVKYFSKYKNVEMVYGEGYYTTEQGEFTERYPTEPFDKDRLVEICYICQPTAFFRKSIFEKCGLLDEKLNYCMDYELWMRIARKGIIAYCPEVIATSRLYQDNKTLGKRKEVFNEIIKTVKKNYNCVPYSWTYGHADYIFKGKVNSINFKAVLLYLFIKYNISNPKYILNSIKIIFKAYLKQKLYLIKK